MYYTTLGDSMQYRECPICKRQFSSRHFVRHCRETEGHEEMFLEPQRKFDEHVSICVTCGKSIEKNWQMLNEYLLILNGFETNTRNINKKYCCRKCFENSPLEVWNKGLTKETHPSIKRLAENRRGENNPVHKMLSDEAKRNQWIEKLKITGKKIGEQRQGKKIEELYGVERADKIREEQRVRATGNSYHTGHFHTEETKAILREKSVKQWTEHGGKTSITQKSFKDEIVKRFVDLTFALEYNAKYYAIDVACEELKLAIEFDGDFWHSNKEKGFDKLYPVQKRNLANDKRKNTYLKNKGWTVIRVWESSYLEKPDEVFELIKEVICALQTKLPQSSILENLIHTI
jgi:very-short-patch-repair endonuclease/DNA-directed RNA polymerase subunit N (RpoN/RPB10)